MSIAAEIARSIAASQAHNTTPSRVFARVTPDVYCDLRRLARSLMRGERPGHTLQPTAVVNEAFLRLSQSDIRLNDATHLFRIMAQSMRRVLVDHARERKRLKRTAPDAASDLHRPDTTSQHISDDAAAPLDILDIDAALTELTEHAPRAAVLLELRYFAGLQDIEISELLGVSRPTVERECRFAKAFFVAYARRRRTPAS